MRPEPVQRLRDVDRRHPVGHRRREDVHVRPRRIPGRSVVNYCLLGGLWGALTHMWAIHRGILDKPPMVTPESARMVMETYTAADLSADLGEPVDLPLSNRALSQIADLKKKNRAGAAP